MNQNQKFNFWNYLTKMRLIDSSAELIRISMMYDEWCILTGLTFEVLEDLVFELEDVFRLVLLLHFKSHVHAQIRVIGLENVT